MTSMLLALAAALAFACAYIPFLNLPFGGGFTVASMLPVVLIAYMYGTRWDLSRRRFIPLFSLLSAPLRAADT